MLANDDHHVRVNQPNSRYPDRSHLYKGKACSKIAVLASSTMSALTSINMSHFLYGRRMRTTSPKFERFVYWTIRYLYICINMSHFFSIYFTLNNFSSYPLIKVWYTFSFYYKFPYQLWKILIKNKRSVAHLIKIMSIPVFWKSKI